MKRCNSKICLFLVICFLCIFKSPFVLASSDNDIKQFGEKNITDINKIWTVEFKGAVDKESAVNNIYVRDLNTGFYIHVKVQKGNTDNSIQVLPPYGGYIKGHSYEININKNVKSIKNINLKKDVFMKFNVKNAGEYEAKINVIVGEAPFTMFKKITVQNVSLDKVKKFKVEDGEQVQGIGGTSIIMTQKDKLKIEFYDDENKVIGQSEIYVNNNSCSKIEIK